MWNLLKNLKKHLSYSIAGAMITGLITGYFFDVSFLKQTILPLTLLMIYPAMVPLKYSSLHTNWKPGLQITTFLINFLIMPFFAFFLGKTFFPTQPYMAFGLLLIGLLPTSGMTISWTNFAKGDTNSAIKMVILGLLGGAFLAPIYANLLMGTTIEIPILDTMIRILLIIILPLIAGFLTQKVIISKVGEQEFSKGLKQKFPLFSTLAVVLMIFSAIALKAKTIINHPELLFMTLPPLLLFYLLSFTMIHILGRRFFKPGENSALVFGTAVRNLSVALAISMTLFGKSEGSAISVIIALAFIVQIQASTLYLRFGVVRSEKKVQASGAQTLPQEG